MMSAKNHGIIPQVGQDSGPKSHPDHSGCPTDSGEGNQTFLTVPQPRRNSLASTTSMGSDFSHATAQDLEYCERQWGNVLKAREEEQEIFGQVETLLANMTGACKIQKNVNNTVKEGILSLSVLFEKLKLLRRSAEEIQDRYHHNVNDIEVARDARKRTRSRIQGRLLKDAVLAASASAPAKRVHSPSESSDEHEPKVVPKKKKK